MIVGEAHVIVRAMTDKVRGDIQRAFSGLDDIGRDANRDLMRGFSRGGGRAGGGMFESLVAQSDAARASFDSLIRTAYTLGPAIFGILGALSSLIGAFSGLALAVAGAIPSLVALPGILAAVGAAAVTLKLAFQGVGNAISAGLQAAGGGGGGGRAAERDLTNLLRRLADARTRYARLQEKFMREMEEGERKLAEAEEEYNQQKIDSLREVADARQKVAEVTRDGLEDIADAQANLQEVEERAANDIARAKRRVERAQSELNAAFKAGREEIQQLNFAAEDAVIAEKRAALELEKAREGLLRVQDLPPNDRARREAELAFAQADLNYRRAMDTNADMAEEQDRLNREGIEGTAAVSRARENLASAEEAKADAEIRSARDIEEARVRLARVERDAAEARAKAEENLARTIEEENKKIRDAKQKTFDIEAELAEKARKFIYEDSYDALLDIQRAEEDLAKARRAGAAAGAGGVNAYKQALAKLSKEQRQFVKFMVDEFVPSIDDLRDAAAKEFFPKLIPAMREIKDVLFPALQPLLQETGSVLGDIAQDFSDTLTSPQFLSSLKNIWDNINANILPGLGEVGTNLLSVISRTLEAAEPVINRFVDWLESVTGGWADNLASDEALDGLTDLFNTSADIAGQIGDLFSNVFGGLGNLIGNQMDEESGGRGLLQFFVDAAAKFKEFTESDGGRITEFFQNVTENAKPILSFIGDLVKEFLKLGENPEIQGFFDKLLEYDIGNLIREIGDAFLVAGPQIADFAKNFLEFTKATLESEGVQAFFATFSSIFEKLTAFFEKPAVKAIAPTIAQIAAVGVVLRTAFTLLKIPVLGLLNPFLKIGAAIKKSRESGGLLWKVISKLATPFKILGGFLKTVFLKVLSVLSRLFISFAFKLIPMLILGIKKLGIAFLTNPIGLIITAVGLLIAGLVLLFQKNETFRNIVLKVWGAIQEKVQTVITWFQENVWPVIQTVVDNIVAFFRDTLLPGIKDAWDKIYSAIQVVISWFRETVWPIIQTVIDLIVGYYKFLWNIIKTIWNGILTAIRAVIDWFRDTAWPIIQNVIDWIKGAFETGKSVVETVWNVILSAIEAVINWFRDTAWPLIQTVIDWIKGAFDTAKGVIETVWNAIKSAIQTVGNWLRDTLWPIIQDVWEKIKTGIDTVKGVIDTAWTGIKNAIRTAAQFIQNTVWPIIKDVWENIKTGVDTVWTKIKDIWDNIKEKIETVAGAVKRALSGLWSGLSSGLTSAFNRVKGVLNPIARGINKMIDGINAVNPLKDIPKFRDPLFLAKGGVVPAVRGGTIAVLGEGGRPERVEPLDDQGLSRRDRAIIDMLSGGGARGATINVYASPGMDEIEIANIVSREISFMMRKGSV